jgi:hypothetical protein
MASPTTDLPPAESRQSTANQHTYILRATVVAGILLSGLLNFVALVVICGEIAVA